MANAMASRMPHLVAKSFCVPAGDELPPALFHFTVGEGPICVLVGVTAEGGSQELLRSAKKLVPVTSVASTAVEKWFVRMSRYPSAPGTASHVQLIAKTSLLVTTGEDAPVAE